MKERWKIKGRRTRYINTETSSSHRSWDERLRMERPTWNKRQMRVKQRHESWMIWFAPGLSKDTTCDVYFCSGCFDDGKLELFHIHFLWLSSCCCCLLVFDELMGLTIYLEECGTQKINVNLLKKSNQYFINKSKIFEEQIIEKLSEKAIFFDKIPLKSFKTIFFSKNLQKNKFLV